MGSKSFYRTYIIEFRTSEGIKVYGGKHVSRYSNPDKDSYNGSGVLIKRAIKKYGNSCIVSKQWFPHCNEQEMDSKEKELILDLKNIFGGMCCNLASGGEGGNTYKYKSKEELDKIRYKKSVIMSKVYKDTEQRKLRSLSMKAYYSDNQEARDRVAENTKKLKRVRNHWNHYPALYLLWKHTGRKGIKAFTHIMVSLNYPKVSYEALILQFRKDYKG